MEYEEIGSILLKSCQICERTFNPKSLERHEKICEKSKRRVNRAPFNSFLQRAKEIPVIPTASEKNVEKRRFTSKPKEQQSSINRKSKIQQEKSNNLAQKADQSGYQRCPCCSRHFNLKAADRHIQWCQDQHSRLPNTPPNTLALERLRARVKYQAPLPRRKSMFDPSDRLVKSAESIRSSSSLRSRSFPILPCRDETLSRQTLSSGDTFIVEEEPQAPQKSLSFYESKNTSLQCTPLKTKGKNDNSKKTVKFKNMFPKEDKDRNNYLEVLSVLRRRLSLLTTDDESLEELKLSNNTNNLAKSIFHESLSSLTNHDYFTGHGDRNNTSSSSEDSFTVNPDSTSDIERVSPTEEKPADGRLPRFCYNCGTKYPVVSAKYCCECGAQRFVLCH